MNKADILVRRKGQIVVPTESRADVSAHGLWEQGTTTVFDILIVNLDAGPYLLMMPEKSLVKAEK